MNKRSAIITATLLAGLVTPAAHADSSAERRVDRPSCEDLIRVDKEVDELEEVKAVSDFLNKYYQEWDGDENYKKAEEFGELLDEHRDGPDEVRYTEHCLSMSAEFRLNWGDFCEEHHARDKYLWDNYTRYKKAHEARVRADMGADYDFVALGTGGKPLATNLSDFLVVHAKYQRVVNSNKERLRKQKQWLDGWLERDSTIHTRCAELDR